MILRGLLQAIFSRLGFFSSLAVKVSVLNIFVLIVVSQELKVSMCI